MADMVNHPAHYLGANGIEAIDVIEGFDLGFHLGNAFKYLVRADKKGPAVEDLKKARWYLERWLRAGKVPQPYSSILDWHKPDAIGAAFGLVGNRRFALAKILHGARSGVHDNDFAGISAVVADAMRAVEAEIKRLEARS